MAWLMMIRCNWLSPPLRSNPMAKRNVLGLIATLSLGACSLAPLLNVPQTPMAAQFHTQGPWTVGTPNDQASRDGWWRVYNDPQLDAMQQQLLKNNADLSAARALPAVSRVPGPGPFGAVP